MAIVYLYSFFVKAQEVELHKVYFHPGQQLAGDYLEVKENNLPIKGAQMLYQSSDQTLYQSSDQTLWMGTEGDGLISYMGNAIKHYRFDPKNKASLPGNRIDEIWEESLAILWISTNNGIAKLDRLSGRITRFGSKTYYVGKTQNSTLYTSVIGKGLYRIDTVTRKLHRVPEQRILNEKGMLYPGETMTSINRLQTDKKRVLWAVGRTQTLEGLFRFDEQTDHWICYAPDAYYYPFLNLRLYKQKGPPTLSTVTLFIDDNNCIWFGGWGVAYSAIIKKSNMLQRFSINKYKSNIPLWLFVPAGNDEFYVCAQKLYKLNLKSGLLQTILVKIKNEGAYKHQDYYQNILWNDSTLFSCRRTTANAGLVKVNLKRGETQLYKTASTQLSPRFPQDNEVVGLTKDSYNRIWCGTAGGVDILYPDKEVFEHYASVEGDITSLLGTSASRVCEAPDGTFYIASQSGVCATKAVPGTRATFTPIAYLDCDWIVADKTSMLWVCTPQGVVGINPITKRYKMFGIEDGFYWDALRKPLVMPNGRFIMHNGAIIDPAAITQNTFRPVPCVSDFWWGAILFRLIPLLSLNNTCG